MNVLKTIICAIVTVVIIGCSKDDNSQFEPILAIDAEFYSDGEVEMLSDNAGPDGITMVFIGDGYIKEDLGRVYGSYRIDAERYFDALFATEPFASYQEHFNAAIVYAESKTRTIPTEYSDLDSTALGVYTYEGWTGNSFFSSDLNRLTYYKNKLPSGYSFHSNILIVVNQNGGGNACSACDISYAGSNSVGTMIHEIGHSFGGLADEYELNIDAPFSPTDRPNLDTTDDLSKIKWKHFIGLDRYTNVNAYEGGGYVSDGVWRPQIVSIMRGGSGPFAEQFNAPSREAIVKRILNIRGIQYDFDSFLEKDLIATINRSVQNSTSEPVFCNGYF